MDPNLQHLRLLSIFHYVLAGLTGLFLLLWLFYVVMGVIILNGHLPANQHGDDPRVVGWVFIAMGLVMSLFTLAYAGLVAYGGRCLAQQRRHTLCVVVGAVLCLFMPLGTVLGVFTIIVLSKPEVKALFDRNSA